MKRIIFFFATSLMLSGCFVVSREFVPVNPMSDRRGGWFGDSQFASNGEQIYFTGVNDRGQRIRYSGGPNFGGMMMGIGSNLACVSCHAADGRGGLHTMHMDVMEAPDIRYSALAGEGEDHGGEEDSHAGEHGGYDLDDFRLAVVGGVHPDGEKLSREMPRWLMSDEDITDLFEYIKSLD
jgi:cytochrome c oxidase subunit 2